MGARGRPAGAAVSGAGDLDDAGVPGIPGIRGLGAIGPRWQHLTPEWDAMVAAFSRGGAIVAADHAERIRAATLVADVDAEGLDLRGRVTTNLSFAARDRGDLDGAIELLDEALDLYERVEAELGDARRTADARAAALISRAQLHQMQGLHAQSLADADAASAIQPSEVPGNAVVLWFGLHLARGIALLELGCWEEAIQALQTARDLALEHDPRLAVRAYVNLGVVRGRIGDREGERQQIGFARELATDPDVAAELDESLALHALQLGDLDGAETLLTSAERGYAATGDRRRLGGCRRARAGILLRRHDLVGARQVAEAALTDFVTQADSTAQLETQLLLGEIDAAAGRWWDADAHYLAARAIAAGRGAPHDAARIDVIRATRTYEQAERATSLLDQRRLLTVALDLALPAALATDALRGAFRPGVARERWVADVASESLSIALGIIANSNVPRLAIEVLEHVSAASGLDPGILLPRVRAYPDGSPQFHQWIDEAERRYGVRVRSREVIDAW
jgi:tetratricopeptide (TPR) repeat protein